MSRKKNSQTKTTRRPSAEPSNITPPIESPGNKPSIELPASDEPLDTHPLVTPSSKKPESITTKPTAQNLCTVLSDIENSGKLNKAILDENECDTSCSELTINSTINQTAETLKNINSIKDELCKLPLDPCENQYITNTVFPLLNVLYQLSTVSLNLASSVNYLSLSPIVHPKKSDLKDTIHLIYKLNDECEDIYDVLKKRIQPLVND